MVTLVIYEAADIIQERLETSRKELLDLSYSNKLLNYRELTSRGVQIVDELSCEVLRTLYVDQHAMTFAPLPEAEERGAEDSPDESDPLEVYLVSHREDEAKDDENGAAVRHYDRILQTKYGEAVLERRLLNTYYTARTSLEEHGVNILFLALGMLHWSDPNQPDKEIVAPVVLLPVELDRRNARAVFKVKHNGDEIGANVSLHAKLLETFGADWPVFDDPEAPEDFDLNQYLDQCETVVDQREGWRLERNEINMGFFSFHKFVIYQDLDPRRWGDGALLGEHETISSILGDGGFSREEPVIPSNANLDRILDRKTLFHVTDADSSQSEVLAEAGSGKSMIVQGPPGTGKSQTITNLIAQCVAEGKTVLFVAEKMAAIEVVKRRLDNIGLGDIALELHSNKTSKREFLEHLKKVWALGPPRESNFDADLHQLTENMQALNQHAAETNESIGASGKTLYHIFGRLMNLSRGMDGSKLPALTVEGWNDWSEAQYSNAMNRAEELQVLSREIGVLAEHSFRDARVTAVLPSEIKDIGSRAENLLEEITRVDESVGFLRDSIGLACDLSTKELTTLLDQIKCMCDWPDLTGMPTDNHAWVSEHDNICGMLEYARKISDSTSSLSSSLKDEAWTHQDADALATCLDGFTDVWYRWLVPTYRAACQKAADLWRIKPPFRLQDRVKCLKAVVEVQRGRNALAESDEGMRIIFGEYWRKDESDLPLLRLIAEGLYTFHSCALPDDLKESVSLALSSGIHMASILPEVDAAQKCLSAYLSHLADVLSRLSIAAQTNDSEHSFYDYPMDVQRAFLKSWATEPQKLAPISRYNAMHGILEKEVLLPLMNVAGSWALSGSKLAALLEMRWCESLLKHHLLTHPWMNQFSPGIADRWVDQFRVADKRLFTHNRVRVLKAHHSNLPASHGAGEMALLNREFNKKSRHLPIRILMDGAGLAIQRAKPVFMMSPFSVATYLPRTGLPFDTVIFDEASQIRPVDALGAIARGKQVIVVGDSKQLPPTSFFDRLQSDDSDDESETRDVESILKQFASKGAFSRMLRWHYRSRHNSLIEYSNHGFYDGNLTVFPSPCISREVNGLRFEHVQEGVYQRGAGKRKNPVEAQRVAEYVMEHARTRPELSLGVAAFSMAQMQEVMDRVEILRRQHPETEVYFTSHPYEPFFVKNLENVQGDERDVILISVGYGRTDAGTISMSFGPLNNEGGERRLNVLISRAKLQCVVFSNLTYGDIDLSKTKSAGVRHLKGYLQFAEKGYIDQQEPSGREPDSPFEVEVAAAIRSMGYEVHHQIGSAGYFIDLAIVDPASPGRYLLGIECDGATYHSSRWARDRDRLRQQVLEGLGWTMHRIWSKSWFEDPETELKKIHSALELDAPISASKPPAVSTLSSPVIERMVPGKKAACGEPISYEMAALRKMSQFSGSEKVKERKLRQMLMQVIETESPIHVEEALKRVLSATGIGRMGSRIRYILESALISLENSGKVKVLDGFAWNANAGETLVRDRSAINISKNIEHVPVQEISRASSIVVAEACRISREDLFREVLRMLGLGALSQQRRDYIGQVMDRLVEQGRFTEEGGRITMGENPPSIQSGL